MVDCCCCIPLWETEDFLVFLGQLIPCPYTLHLTFLYTILLGGILDFLLLCVRGYQGLAEWIS